MKQYKVTIDTGTTRWYNLQDQLHREDGPAIEWSDGSKEWYLKGQRHREDGPAIEWSDGSKWWYLKGQRLTEEQWRKATQTCAGKTVVIDGKTYKLILQ